MHSAEPDQEFYPPNILSIVSLKHARPPGSLISQFNPEVLHVSRLCRSNWLGFSRPLARSLSLTRSLR